MPVDRSKIHGDRSTLNSSGQELASAAKELSGVTHVLNTRVNDLVHDAGWSGAAAEAFKQDWQMCSAAGGGLIEAMTRISTTMEHLAAALAKAQSDLDDAKDHAKAHDIELDEHGEPVQMSLAPPVTEYLNRAALAVQNAKQARDDAAQDFAAIVTQLAPGGDSKDTLGTSDNITLADAARSLYGIPAARAAIRRSKVESLNHERVDMKRMHKHMRKQSREWKEFQTERLANRQALRDAKTELANLEKANSKWKLSGNMEIEFARLREKLHINAQMSAIDSIPVFGTLVAGGGIYLGVKDDMEKGWGFWHSVGVETGTTVLSMAAGMGAEAGLAEGASVTAGVATSVAAGYGVGTYANELIKAGHWQQNIHDHGVFSGIAHSIGDASTTWWDEDVVGMGDKINNSAVSVWNDIF